MKMKAVVTKTNNLTGICKLMAENCRTFTLYAGRQKQNFEIGLVPGDVVTLADTCEGYILDYEKSGHVEFVKGGKDGEAIGASKLSSLIWNKLATADMKSAGHKGYKMVIK